jgi:2-oxo-3-hexenedioate decarboxylase
MVTDPDITKVAEEVLIALADRAQIQTFSSRPGGLNLAQAYQVTPLLRAAFESRGETITGRKIGFTNRQMWKPFGVDSPVWGYATSRATYDLADKHSFASGDFLEPRIEPEIMFGIKTPPAGATTDDALLDCLDWVALGYEIVQSIYPNWKFSASDTVAANGVHGALLVGRRHAITPRKAEWLRELSTFQAELYCDGKLVQRGGGALVLDSPLNALRHLVELLEKDPLNPALRSGEIISTGTLTLAMPVGPGERWTTKVSGIPFEDISIACA